MAHTLAFWKAFTRANYAPPPCGPRLDGPDHDSSWRKTTTYVAKAFHTLYNQLTPNAAAFLGFVATELLPAVASEPREAYIVAVPLHYKRNPQTLLLAGALTLLLAKRLKCHYPVRCAGPLYDPLDRITAFLRDEVQQNTPIWYAVRAFFIGASRISSIFGTNPYEGGDQAQKVLLEHRGIAAPKPFSPFTLKIFANGHVGEGLGRELFTALTGQRVVQIGMGVSSDDAAFAHSPDGLVVDADEHPVGMIEIKFHSKLASGVYNSVPDVYIMQCLQGMRVHGVPWCAFVSTSYKNYELEGRYARVTIEKIYYDAEVADWMASVLSIYSACLRARKDALPTEFYDAQKERMFSRLRREPVQVSHDGFIVPCVALTVDLDIVLGEERRHYWAKQPFHRV